MSSQSRRSFLGHLTGGVVASAVVPTWVSAEERSVGLVAAADGASLWERGPALMRDIRAASSGLGPNDAGDEDFWRLVKQAFPLRPGLTLMNAANLCPSPISVQQRVFELTRDVDRDASFQNRGKFGELKEASRTALARYLGAATDEIAIVRNTSAGNATVINGLDLGGGDEVVLWTQNHPTNNVAWSVRSERRGFSVKHVATPPDPTSADELIGPFLDALSPRTRLVSVSHVSNISGVRLPVERLCSELRSRGVLSLVDGAQSFGCLQVDLHQMGCDFYTGSAHKWFVGPKEAGVLYVREDAQADTWATFVGVGWERAREGGARKFENLGQRDDAAVAAMATTVEFHETVGPARVEARVNALAAELKARVEERLPGTRLHTPRDPELSAGVVVFLPPGLDARKAFGTLYTEHSVAGAAMGGDFTGIRLCPHVYNTMSEVERVVEAVASMA